LHCLSITYCNSLKLYHKYPRERCPYEGKTAASHKNFVPGKGLTLTIKNDIYFYKLSTPLAFCAMGEGEKSAENSRNYLVRRKSIDATATAAFSPV
jgi:hypothetical protein